MSLLDALWHLLNFLAPALFVALFTAVAAKLVLGRSRLRPIAWRGLLAWTVVPTLAATIAGLVLTGRDGAMLTYAAMVVAAALGSWIGIVVRGRG